MEHKLPPNEIHELLGVSRSTYYVVINTPSGFYFPASATQAQEIQRLLAEVKMKLDACIPESTPPLLGPAEAPKSQVCLLPVQKKESEVDDNLKRRFRSLTERWKTETQFTSTVIEIVTHPAYQQIIGMGPAIIPLILHQLAIEADHWFWALKAITGEDPVNENSRGKLMDMARAWLEWGESQGYEC